jgi:membrane protein DedA with SNARE-associated domain
MSQILGNVASWVVLVISNFGYWGTILCMAIEGACIPLPSEVILPFSGFLVSTGRFDFWPAALAGAFGNAFGSTFMYYAGKKGGYHFLRKYGKYFLISRSDMEKAEKWFAKYGRKTVFASQLLPVIRTYISLPSGILQIGYLPFVFLTFLGGLVWSTFLVYLGMVFGKNWPILQQYFKKFDLIITVLLIAGLVFFIWHKLKKFKEISEEK